MFYLFKVYIEYDAKILIILDIHRIIPIFQALASNNEAQSEASNAILGLFITLTAES